MSEAEARKSVVTLWMAKAEQALAAARREQAAGDLDLTVNRIYYACFYATSAILLSRKLTFSSHGAVRAALHQHLVKPGLLPKEFGNFFDKAFDNRHEADYSAISEHDPLVVEGRIETAARFVMHLRGLLPTTMGQG